jgi:hypothetical protein
MRASEGTFRFPETGLSIRDAAVLLAIDDASLGVRKNLCLYVVKPSVRAEPVLEPSPRGLGAPDDVAAHFYGTVLREEGRFRMWYYACHWGRNPDWKPHMARQIARYDSHLFIGPLCYAESGDGVAWTKPHLGQVLFKGTRDNNALALPHTLVDGATLIRDDQDADPAQRYKMVYGFLPGSADPPLEGVAPWPTVATAVSPDGIQWTPAAVPFPYEFIEQASFYRHNGLYVVNAQSIGTCIPGEGGTSRGRQGFARFSHDFEHWVDGHVESFALPEPADAQQRGENAAYDQVHLGVGAASLGNACVGLYGMWHNAHFHDEFGRISCDLGLLVSNDGLRFREPVKGHVFLSRDDSPATPCPGARWNTILCQANGILNVGDETRIYHGRWRNTGQKPEDLEHYRADVALATLPRDRWGALGLFPNAAEGWVWSAPVELPRGAAVTLNADRANLMRVELADERFEPIRDFSGDDAGRPKGGGGLDCAVAWPAGRSLAALEGRTVRFRVLLRRNGGEPRLYALNLSSRR